MVRHTIQTPKRSRAADGNEEFMKRHCETFREVAATFERTAPLDFGGARVFVPSWSGRIIRALMEWTSAALASNRTFSFNRTSPLRSFPPVTPSPVHRRLIPRRAFRARQGLWWWMRKSFGHMEGPGTLNPPCEHFLNAASRRSFPEVARGSPPGRSGPRGCNQLYPARGRDPSWCPPNIPPRSNEFPAQSVSD